MRYPACGDVIPIRTSGLIIFEQSAYSILAGCQALVIFLRLVFSEFSRVEVKF